MDTSISSLEQRVAALYPASDTTTPKRVVCYLMIAKYGPKVEAVHQATNYARFFISDEIMRLNANKQLLTGTLDRDYLKPLLKGNLSILDEVLGASPLLPTPAPPVRAIPVTPKPVEKLRAEPLRELTGGGFKSWGEWSEKEMEKLDLHTLTLEEAKAICRARKIHQGKYKQCLNVEKRLLNRLTALKKQNRGQADAPASKPASKRGRPTKLKKPGNKIVTVAAAPPTQATICRADELQPETAEVLPTVVEQAALVRWSEAGRMPTPVAVDIQPGQRLALFPALDGLIEVLLAEINAKQADLSALQRTKELLAA